MKTARDYRCDLSVLEDGVAPLPWSEFCESGDWWIESADQDGSPLLGRSNLTEHFVADANHMSTQNMLYIVWAANTAPELVKALEAAEAKADRILDAYHMSYRHGPDPDPKRCPACHAAALDD